MKKKFLTALISAVMVFSLTACQSISPDKSGDKKEDGSDSLPMPPKVFGSEEDIPAPGELDDATEYLLFNTYIDINNAMVGRIYDSLDRYFTYVDLESDEFKLLDENGDYYDCYSVFGVQSDLDTAYEIADSKGEKDVLDQAFLGMYPSITTLIQTLNEISEYTTAKTYLEDSYAKSQEQHTALISALEEYYNTGDLFRTELSIVADQRQAEELEEMKAEGYVVLYSLNMVINLGKQIENELYLEGVWDDNILDMDLTVIQPLYDEFSQYVDDVLAYNENEDALRAEGLANSAYWSTFVMNMKSTRDSISKVLAKVEAGEPLDQFDTIITSMAGHCNLSSFSEGVSGMINSYNRLISY